MIAIIGASTFSVVIILSVLLICGLPLGELTMGGRYKVFPQKLRIVLVLQLALQMFFVIIILQMGGIVPLWFSRNITKIICVIMAAYLSLNTVMNCISKSKKEKVVMKVIEMVVCCMLIVTLVGCKNAVTTNVKIDYGTSAIYTKEDMDSAIDTIKETFKSFEGCELYTLSYSFDDVCRDEENIAWMNDLERANDNKQIFTQCIMFDSSFRSPKKGGGAWEPNEEYTWSWWLARSEGGEWKLMTYGY